MSGNCRKMHVTQRRVTLRVVSIAVKELGGFCDVDSECVALSSRYTTW